MTVTDSQQGFTLIEMLAVVFIITVGLTSVFSLIQTTSFSSQLTADQLTATYLAQEGVELVRSVRETNWLEDRQREGDTAWDEDLEEGEWQMDYTSLEQDPDFIDYDENRYLRLNNEGYNYDPGNDTRFRRKIIIEKEDSSGDGEDDTMKIRVEVSFESQGETYTINSQETLYNWR